MFIAGIITLLPFTRRLSLFVDKLIVAAERR
jgi:hypothetical protein